MLGMVRLGATSGYAIKKATDASTRHFWPTSLAQVYPELSRLQADGLLTRRDDPQGRRSRSAYALTDRGREALLDWLLAPEQSALQFRDEGVLRLFFADALAPEDRPALIRRLRERARSAAAAMRDEILPAAEALEAMGTAYPAIVARLGADTYSFAEQWLARLEGESEAAARGESR